MNSQVSTVTCDVFLFYLVATLIKLGQQLPEYLIKELQNHVFDVCGGVCGECVTAAVPDQASTGDKFQWLISISIK